MKPGGKTALLAGILIAVLVSLFSGSFNRYYLGIAIDCGINIILAVSLNLINGYTGQFSLGHAGFMAVGGYIAAKISLVCGVAFFPLGIVGAGLGAAVAGLAVGIPSLRLRGDYLAIVTLGFGEIIRVLFQNSETFGAATGLNGIPRVASIAWVFSMAVLAIYVVWALVNSTYGRGFVATSDDEVAASAMGINTTRYKVTAFVVGAFFAGVAGALFAHHKGVMKPDTFDFTKSIEIVVMVILGGMGRTVGVILAAIILTVMPELLRTFAAYRMILYSLLIIVLMIARPQGLFVWKKKGVVRG